MINFFSRFFIIFIFIFVTGFLFKDSASAEMLNCNPNTTTCDWLHVRFINTNDGTTWEVRYKYYYKVGVSSKSYPSSSTKSVMVPKGGTSVPLITTPTSYYGYYVKWTTTCVDPPEYFDTYSNRIDGIPQFYWNIYINPQSVAKKYKPVGNGQNLGTVGWTGGSNSFVPGSQAKCKNTPPPKPCPEPKRPKAGWCGTKTNSCGKSKTWKCSGALDCQNHKCVCPEPAKPSGWECGTKKNKCGNKKTWSCTGANQGCENHQCVNNRYSISGNVWVDENYSGGTQQAEKDTDAEGITVRTSNNSKSTVTNEDGEYVLDGFAPGGYTVQVNDPGIYNVVETGPQTRSVPPDRDSVDFRLTRRFSISGGVFTNTDNNRNKKSNSESYRASQTIEISKLSGGVPSSSFTTQTINSGTSGFTINNLMPGNYRVRYSSMPATGFNSTYPTGRDANSLYFDVSVGSGRAGTTRCATSGHVQAECQNGSIENLNFGIEAQGTNPWWQSVGGNVRIESGINNIIPDNAGNTCTASTEGFVSAKSTSAGLNSPGIVLSGKKVKIRSGSESTANQAARANSNGWLITEKPFKPARGNVIRTSYEYLYQNISKGGLTINTMFNTGDICGGVQEEPRPYCEWNGNFAKGIYRAVPPEGAEATDGTPLSLTIANPGANDDTDPYTFDNGNTASKKDYIFLIAGDLKINRNIYVDNGDSVIFAVKGDIIVADTVTRIDGIYSAGGDFIVESNGGTDSRLTVNGSIIAKASPDETAAEGASFVTKRSLGTGSTTGNAVCPTVKVVYRPDFILNAPDALKVRNTTVREVSASSPKIAVTNPPTPTPKPTFTGYGYDSGTNYTITINAEASSPLATRFDRSTDSWDNRTSPLSYTGSAYIAALDDDGTSLTSNLSNTAPEVRYNVCFPTSGRYWIWVRGSAPNAAGDAIAFGIDGSVQASANPFVLYKKDIDGTADWQWRGRINNISTGDRAYVDVGTAGFHNLNLYMRNDGSRIDKIYLTDTSTAPSFANGSNAGPDANSSIQCEQN